MQEEIEIVEGGGKGAKREGWPTEIPPFAQLELAKVMKLGAEKYGKKNWHGNSVEVELDHQQTHYLNFMAGIGNPLEELSHCAARVMMALDTYIRHKRKDDGEHCPTCGCYIGDKATMEIYSSDDGVACAKSTMPDHFHAGSYNIPPLGKPPEVK